FVTEEQRLARTVAELQRKVMNPRAQNILRLERRGAMPHEAAGVNSAEQTAHPPRCDLDVDAHGCSERIGGDAADVAGELGRLPAHGREFRIARVAERQQPARARRWKLLRERGAFERELRELLAELVAVEALEAERFTLLERLDFVGLGQAKTLAAKK